MNVLHSQEPWNLATMGVFGDPFCQGTHGMFCEERIRPPFITVPPAPDRLAQEARDRRDLLDMLGLIVKSYG